MPANVVVIGAGASGLTAAAEAARSGADVTLLEAQKRPGKKLLITGNGSCNMTNLSPDLPRRYFGSGSDLAKTLTEQYGARRTLDFFAGLGLLTRQKNDCVYPASGQAASVLNVLLTELERLQVKMKFSERVTDIVPSADLETYLVKTAGWQYQADAVIISCGSKADPQTGACSDGYTLAEKLGHSLIPVRPALVPLCCRARYLGQLNGVRCRAKVSLRRIFNEEFSEEIASDTGELQWTKYGLSGIVIFQLSRFVSAAAPQERFLLRIDLLPDYSGDELEALLISRAKELGKVPLRVLFKGILNEKLIPVILGLEEDLPGCCADLDREKAAGLCRRIKAFEIPVTGTASFEMAQICCGGVDCAGIDGHLQSRIHKGLYFTGELLDVDGPCGGYNLQWAFTSGHFAGIYAAGDAS